MSQHIKLKKGFDIKIAGKAEQKIREVAASSTFAVKPDDFKGIERPKLLVKEGDSVKAGSPLMFDKKSPNIKFTAPVSGEVIEIRRGEKRKILEIVVLADKDQQFEEFKKVSVSDLKNLTKEDAIEQLSASGAWVQLTQRPFGIVANPEETPKSIFISAFDSHPLAADYNFIYKDEQANFQAGIDILKKFTSGQIHLNINADAEVNQMFAHAKDVQLNKISGKHPAGNVGVQIHHLDPINKGDVVWTIDPFGVIMFGKLFLEGRYDTSKTVAVAGSMVEAPSYVKTNMGACVENFVKDNLKGDHVRIISGNVLTGENIGMKGHLGHFHNLITVIEEGDQYEAFGWVLPQFNKPSFHRALGLMAFMTPQKEFAVNTNMNGEARAFVQTGVFEKVLPMDILPTYLIKAILAEDFDEIEALGIYELIEEDLALCEFIDVSKHDIQAILREGIDLIQYS